MALTLALLLGLAGLPLPVRGQDTAKYPRPVGKFKPDTANVAAPLSYVLTVRRPLSAQVIYPDSLYDFSPFELRSQRWFPTRTLQDSLVLDSAVFELQVFSSAPALEFALPVFYILPGGDSLPVFASLATLHQRVPKTVVKADSLAASSQTFAVSEQFNYPYWILGITLAVSLLGVANAFLGKPAQRYFKLWIERQRHRAFIRTYDRLVAQVRMRGAKGPLEKALNLWKAYIERVEEIPYTTYTTKDFGESLPDPALTKSLQSLDKYIYGGFEPNEAPAAYAVLRRMAIRIYAQKSQELRHG